MSDTIYGDLYPANNQNSYGVPLFSRQTDPGSMLTHYTENGWSARQPQVDDVFDPSSSVVRYSDPVDHTVPRFIKSKDLMTLDPDPFGVNTVKFGEATGQALDNDYTAGLTVFGKPMSREQLMKTDEGRELLMINEKNRAGIRKDFFEALVHDAHLTDFIPFFGTVATLEGSISSANRVSDTFKKLQNGEKVSDDDLIKARLFMAKQERDANATWGAAVGDIIRTTPGFMTEFWATGKMLGGARNLLAKSLSKSGSSLAPFVGMTHAQSFLARKTAEDTLTALGKGYAKSAGLEAATTAGAKVLTTEEGISAALKNPILRNRTYEQLWKNYESWMRADPLTSGLYGRASGAITRMAKQRALYEMADGAARLTTSPGVKRSLASAWRATKDRLTSAFLDYGDWGTSAASVVGLKNDTVSRHVGDAMWNLFFEAPVRGAVIQAPGHFLARPAIGVLTGNGLSPVDPTELNIQASAYAQGNRDLMDRAGSIALGSRAFMYAAGEAGKSFGSIARAIGIGTGLSQMLGAVAKPGAKVGSATAASARIVRGPAAVVNGVTRPGPITDVLFDGIMPEHDAYQIGGILRQLVDRYVTKPQDIRANILADKTDAVMRSLNGVQGLDRTAVETAVRTGSAEFLPQAAKDAIGTDFNAFVNKSLDAAYQAQKDAMTENMRFRSLFWLGIADKIQSSGLSPDAVYNTFEKMGYHGTLGTMLGMRYAEAAKGLFGFDDKDADTFKERLANALEGMWPGWKQITAEAVGFSFPGMVRFATIRAINRLGGGNEVSRAQAMHAGFEKVMENPVLVRSSAKAYHDACVAQQQRLADRKAELQKRLDSFTEEQKADATNIAEIGTLKTSIEDIDRAASGMKLSWEKFEKSLRKSGDGSYDENAESWIGIDRRSAVSAQAKLASEGGAEQSASALDAFRNLAAEYAKTRFILHDSSDTQGTARGLARKAIGVAASLLTGDMSFDLAKKNPMQWKEADAGLPPGLGDALESGYRTVYNSVVRELSRERTSEMERDFREKRSHDKGYDKSSPEVTADTIPGADVFHDTEGPDGQTHSYEVDTQKAHEIAVQRYSDVAKAVVDEYLALSGVMSFSNAEIREIALDDAAASEGLFRKSHADENFTSSDGTVVSKDEIARRHETEINADMSDMMRATYDILLGTDAGTFVLGDGGRPQLQQRLHVRTDNVDGNLQTKNIFNVAPINYNRTDLSVLGKVLRQKSMGKLFVSHEVVEGVPVQDQISCDMIPAKVVNALSRFADMNPDDAVNVSVNSATQYEGAALETLARRLRFPHDGTEQGLAERNRRLIEIVRATRLGADPNARRFIRDRVESDADSTLFQSGIVEEQVKRLANGKWKFFDRTSSEDKPEPRVFDTYEALEAFMAERGWQPAEFEYAVTPVKNLVSDDHIAMLKATNTMREYQLETENAIADAGADSTYPIGDPMFMRNSDGSLKYPTKEAQDAERARIREEAEEFARITGDPSDEAAFRWEKFAPQGADLNDPGVRTRADARMQSLKQSWDRMYDPDIGMMTLADRVLRRRGAEVDHYSENLGLGVRTLALGATRRYSIPVRAWADMTKSGRIYVPVDYEHYQDLPAAFLAASSFRMYFGNRGRMVWNCWHKTPDGKYDAPGPAMRLLARIDKALADAATRRRNADKPTESDTRMAARFEEARDFLNSRDVLAHPGRRWMKAQAFEYINSALVGFQLERDIDAGTSSMPYQDVFREIAKEVRNTDEFRTYFGEIDRLLGGDGFAAATDLTNARRMSGVPGNSTDAPETGLRRWFKYIPGRGGKQFDQAVRDAFMGGMTADQILQVVSELQQRLRETLPPESMKSVDETVASLNEEFTGGSGGDPISLVQSFNKILAEFNARRTGSKYEIKDVPAFMNHLFKAFLGVGKNAWDADPEAAARQIVETVDEQITLDMQQDQQQQQQQQPEATTRAGRTGERSPETPPVDSLIPGSDPAGQDPSFKPPEQDSPINLGDTSGSDGFDGFGIPPFSIDVRDFGFPVRSYTIPDSAAKDMYSGESVVFSAPGEIVPDPSAPITPKVTAEDVSGRITDAQAEELAPVFAAFANAVVPKEVITEITDSKGNVIPTYMYAQGNENILKAMNMLCFKLFPGRTEAEYDRMFRANGEHMRKFVSFEARDVTRELYGSMRKSSFGIIEDKPDDEGIISTSNLFSKYSESEAKSIINRKYASLMSIVVPHDMDSVFGNMADLRAKIDTLAGKYSSRAASPTVPGGRANANDIAVSSALDVLSRILQPRKFAKDGEKPAETRARYDALISELTGLDATDTFSRSRKEAAENTGRAMRALFMHIKALLYGGANGNAVSRHGAMFLMYLAMLSPAERGKFLSSRYSMVSLPPQTINTSVADMGGDGKTTLRPAFTLMNNNRVNSRSPNVSAYRSAFSTLAYKTRPQIKQSVNDVLLALRRWDETGSSEFIHRVDKKDGRVPGTFTIKESVDIIRRNGRKIAGILVDAGIIDSDSPIYSMLTSEQMLRDLRRASIPTIADRRGKSYDGDVIKPHKSVVKNEEGHDVPVTPDLAELAEDIYLGDTVPDDNAVLPKTSTLARLASSLVSYGTTPREIPVIRRLIDALMPLTNGEGMLSAEEAASAGLSMFTVGSPTGPDLTPDYGNPGLRSDRTTELNEFMSAYVTSLPRSIVHADISSRASTRVDDSSVTTVIPGLNPMALEFVAGKFTNLNRKLLSILGVKPEEVESRLASSRQNFTWGNDSADPIFGKLVAKGYTMNQVNDACELSFYLERLADAGAHVPGKGSNVRYSSAESLAKWQEKVAELCSGVSSEQLLKVMRKTAKGAKLDAEEDYLFDMSDAGMKAAGLAFANFQPRRMVSFPVFPGDHSSFVMLQVPVEYLRGSKLTYAEFSKRISDMFGLSSMGRETKRAAVCSSEADPIPLFGIRKVTDGNGTREVRGRSLKVLTWHHAPLVEGSKENEDNIGGTYMYGYGANAIRLASSDPKFETGKVHVMSGNALIKSLTLMTRDGAGDPSMEGEFLAGSAPHAFHSVAKKILGRIPQDERSLSNVICFDRDSVKLDDVINSPVAGVLTSNGKTIPLMDHVFRKLREAMKTTYTDGNGEYTGKDAAGNDIENYGKLEIVSKDGKTEYVDELTAEQLDDFIGPINFATAAPDGTVTPAKEPVKFSELCGSDVSLVSIDDMSSPGFALVMRDDNLMAYNVANVSHFAKPHLGKSPRNHSFGDMITMASAMARGFTAGAVQEDATGADGEKTTKWTDPVYGATAKEISAAVMELMSRHGIVSSVVGLNPDTAAHFAEYSPDGIEHTSGGESLHGQNHADAAAQQISSMIRKDLQIGMFGLDAPLVSSGSTVAYDGRTPVVRHTAKSVAIRDTLKGSRAIPTKLREFFGGAYGIAYRQEALCNVNFDTSDVTGPGCRLRHGWYLNDEAFDRMCKDNKTLSDAWNATDASLPREQRVILTFERLFTDLRNEHVKWSRSGASSEDIPEGVTRIRDVLGEVFMDHHRNPVSTKNVGVRYETFEEGKDGKRKRVSKTASPYKYTVGFEDLFTLLGDGKTPVFDRTAFHLGMRLDADPDKGVNGVTSHIYLGGTRFGFPRTPSYNGAQWNQHVRAGLPVTERKVMSTDSEGRQLWKGLYESGNNAMVSPDPYTLKILGCDHDGDKSKLFMLHHDEYGLSPSIMESSSDAGTAFPIDDLLSSDTAIENLITQDDESDPANPRRVLRQRLRDLGYLERRYLSPEDTVGYEVLSDKYHRMVSNFVVRRLFDMSKMLPVPPADSDSWVPFYNPTPDAENGPASRGVKATVVAEGAMKDALARFSAAADRFSRLRLRDAFRDGQGISDIYHSSHVTTVASQADESRAKSVSLSLALHVAMATGLFDRGSKTRNLFGDMDVFGWIDYIYHQDGVPNATFDDIKNQVCDRLGWTPEMMDTLVIHSMSKKGRAPRTDAEFLDIITSFLDSASNGPYAAMILSGNSSTDRATRALEFRQFLGRVYGGSYNEYAATKSVMRKNFGIDPELLAREGIGRAFMDVSDVSLVDNPGNPYQLVARAVALVAKEEGLTATQINDVATALIDRAATAGSYNVNSGYLYYLLGVATGDVASFMHPVTHGGKASLSPVKTAEDVTAEFRVNELMKGQYTLDAEGRTRLRDEARDFVKWVTLGSVLSTAKKLSASINYTRSNPGDPKAFENVDSYERNFNAFASEVNENPSSSDLSGCLSLKNMRWMNTAMRLSYRWPKGYKSLRATAHMDLADLDRVTIPKIHTISRSGVGELNRAMGRFGGKIAAARKLDSSEQNFRDRKGTVQQLESNAKMNPYIASAIVHMPGVKGPSVFGGDVSTLDVMRKVARAVHRTRSSAFEDLADTGDSALTASFLQAVGSMFHVLKFLAASSRQHAESPAFSGFRVVNKGVSSSRAVNLVRYGKAKYTSSEYTEDYARLGVIAPFFGRFDDTGAQDMFRMYMEQWSDGRMDGRGKRTVTGAKKAADSFDLSADNLVKLLAELGVSSTEREALKNSRTPGVDRYSSFRGSAVDMPGWKQDLVDRIHDCLGIIDALGRKTVITPSSFIRQWLPLYTTIVSETTGSGADASSLSLFPVLPKSVFRTISDGATALSRGEHTGLMLRALNAIDSRPESRKPPSSSVAPDPESSAQFLSDPANADAAAADFMSIARIGDSPDGGRAFGRSLEKFRNTSRTVSDAYRRNPDGARIIDIFANGCPLEELVTVAGAPKRPVRRPGRSGTDRKLDEALRHETAVNEGITGDTADANAERFANAYRGLLSAMGGPEADGAEVTVSGNTIMIRGRFLGSGVTRFLKGAKKAKVLGGKFGTDQLGTAIKVSVTGSRESISSDPAMVGKLAGSLSYAESLFNSRSGGRTIGNALGLRTPGQFLLLPRSVREAFVRKFSFGGNADAKPTFTTDGASLAILTGRISLHSDASTGTAYHELFHTHLRMLRQIGLLTEKDMAALAKVFPGGQGGAMNEEAAAEAFRAYVSSTLGTDPGYHTATSLSGTAEEDRARAGEVFSKVHSALDGIFETVKFTYGKDVQTDEQLFRIVLSGYAAESRDAAGRKRTMSEAELRGLVDSLNVAESVDAALRASARDMSLKDSSFQEPGPEAYGNNKDFADVGFEGYLIRKQLSTNFPDWDAVRDSVERIIDINTRAFTKAYGKNAVDDIVGDVTAIEPARSGDPAPGAHADPADPLSGGSIYDQLGVEVPPELAGAHDRIDLATAAAQSLDPDVWADSRRTVGPTNAFARAEALRDAIRDDFKAELGEKYWTVLGANCPQAYAFRDMDKMVRIANRALVSRQLATGSGAGAPDDPVKRKVVFANLMNILASAGRPASSGREELTAENASSATLVGYLMAAERKRPGEHLASGIDRIKDLAKYSGNSVAEFARYVIGKMSDLRESVETPTGLPVPFDDVFGKFFRDIRSPLEKSWGVDAEGRWLDFRVKASDGTSDPVRDLYNAVLATDPVTNDFADPRAAAVAQDILHVALDTAYGLQAEGRLIRELGTDGDSVAGHEAFDTIFSDLPARPKSIIEMAADNGVGPAQLMSEDSFMSFYDQPAFAAYDTRTWLDASLQSNYGGADGKGGNVPFRESMRAIHNDLDGVSHAVNLDCTYAYRLLGLDCNPGDKLFAIKDAENEWSFGEGGVKHEKTGGTHRRFDAYNDDRTDERTTVESIRANDLYLKSISVMAGGSNEFVTGCDKFQVSGTTRDAMLRARREYGIEGADWFSAERVLARIDAAESGKNADPLDMALSRLQYQIPEEYLGFRSGTGLYRRITESLAKWIRKSAELEKTDIANAKKDGRKPSDARWNHEAINEFVLRGLERDGLMVTTMGNSGTHLTGTASFDTRDYVNWWKGSAHHEQLIRAGRREEELTPQAIAEPFVRRIAELGKLVDKYPFLSSGDGAFFHNIRSLMPFFRGEGMFMWGANRKMRGVVGTQQSDHVSEMERTFLDMVTSLAEGDQTRPTDEQLRFLRKLYRIKNPDITTLRDAISSGAYEKGSELSARTGLVLGRDATLLDVARACYERNCELGWLSSLAGNDYTWARDLVAEIGGHEAIGRMNDAFDTELQKGSLLGGVTSSGYGLTDAQMFRMHGVLPGNFELPKKVQIMVDGIRDAVFFRNSLASLLMTPDLDGMPTCYANPAAHADRKSGLDDSFWGTLARWWGKVNPALRDTYDHRLTGVENAQKMYNLLFHNAEVRDGEYVLGGTPDGVASYTDVRVPGKRYRHLGRDVIDSGISCLQDVVAQNGPEEEAGVGNHAFDYMRHLLQSTRCFGTTATRAAIHRALSWSKSASVAFSFFFPLATKWESPTGAFGAISTIGSNVSPGFMRDHAEAASILQRMFGGSGWITSDFFGAKDALALMDSNDPFYAEVLSWASALGVTLQDHNVNPLDPTRAIVTNDLKMLTQHVTDTFGEKAGRHFKKVTDELLVKSGDRAFAYALNATKVAAVVQMAQKLRHIAQKSGKAFDPLRDLRKYADYLNAEIGGIDPLKYAWAHPEMRSLLERMFFSWQWTRGAWEAGGGGAIEDMLFGTHNTNKEMRKYLLGRWARMYGTVMIGVPMMMQLMAKVLGLAMGHDDDDDKWFTWENEDKTRWSAADITPLLRGMENVDNVIGDATGIGADNANKLWAAVGGAAGYAAGGLPGAIGGAVMGLLAPRYTGRDASNMATGKRRFYMHFGKQGWEFARWFDKPVQQFFSKLSMPTQRVLEGVFGRSLSWMDHELPWNDMGDVERWVNPTTDGAAFNIVKAFLPFTVNGLSQYGDAGFLSAFGPVQMGASKTSIIDRLKDRLDLWAKNDRRAYMFGAKSNFPKVPNRMAIVGDILADARANGYSPKQCEQLVAKALGQVTNRLYGDLFAALPETPDGDFDKVRIERLARAINRLQRKYDAVMTSMKSRLEARGHKWKTLDNRVKDLYRRNVRSALDDPFNYTPIRDEY